MGRQRARQGFDNRESISNACATNMRTCTAQQFNSTEADELRKIVHHSARTEKNDNHNDLPPCLKAANASKQGRSLGDAEG